jgi:hypothetical protein
MHEKTSLELYVHGRDIRCGNINMESERVTLEITTARMRYI